MTAPQIYNVQDEKESVEGLSGSEVFDSICPLLHQMKNVADLLDISYGFGSNEGGDVAEAVCLTCSTLELLLDKTESVLGRLTQ